MKQGNDYVAPSDRWLTHRGDQIRMHRSLRMFEFPKRRWFEVLLLPVGFNVLTLFSLPGLTRFWSDFFSIWLANLDLPGQVTESAPFDLGGQILSIPSILLAGAAPTTNGWLLQVAVTLIVFTLSFWLPDRYIPFRYVLRLLVLVHGSALFYFGFSPASFPYDLETYARDALILMIIFLLIIPWLLAFSYYIYEFSLTKKVAITFLMLVYFCIFAPTQLLVQAIFLHILSPLMLPLLYVAFGSTLNVMLFIAFYSWAMSE